MNQSSFLNLPDSYDDFFLEVMDHLDLDNPDIILFSGHIPDN